MNDALKMQISAFVDDELPESETELLLRRLSQDAALRRQAAGYLRIGRLIRGEREVRGMGELRNRIATALGEPVDAPARPGQSRNRFLKPLAGVSIAATVAALALVGLRQLEVAGPARITASVPALPQTQETQAMNGAGYTEPTPAEALSDQPGEMLMQYYLSHGETTAGLGANGILTRLVTLELREGELVEVRPGQAQSAADTPAGEPDASKDKDNDNEDRDPER